MSIKIMASVWDVEAFKGSKKIIMLCLADFANDEGYAWPSLATVSRKCGISRSTLKVQIKELCDMGVVSVRRRKKEGSKDNDSNMYWLDLRAIRNLEARGAEIQPRSESDLGRLTAGGRSDFGPKPPIDPPNINKPPINPPCEDSQQLDLERKRVTKSPGRRSAFPVDFTITDEMRDWYRDQHGFTVAIQQATEQWRDAILSRGSKYVNWVSAWRNGMRLQNQWAAERGSSGKGSKNHKSQLNQVQEYSEQSDQGQFAAPDWMRRS